MCDKNQLADLVQPFCVIENLQIEPQNWQIEKNRRISKVSLKNVQNENLPVNLAESFPNLLELSTSDTNFRIIKRENLRNLRKLETLRLENGEILKIRRDSFDDLENLRVLDLNKNLLNSLTPELFRQLRNLEDLNISENSIEEINPRLFYNLKNLKFLNADKNKFFSIPADAFYYNRKLKKISFSENNLRFIDKMVFNGLNEIQVVNLNKNDCIDKEYSIKEMRNGFVGSLKKDVEDVCQMTIKI
jgi:Leucine-rich repeat (LRR) protein